MTITRAYYFFFYKLYKFWFSVSDPKLWTDWKAVLIIDLLGVCLGFSMLFYYSVFIDRHFEIGDGTGIVFSYIVVLGIPNYFIFHHRDRWKKIVHEFDKLDARKSKIGGLVVCGFIMLIICNLIFSVYLMSTIDWN